MDFIFCYQSQIYDPGKDGFFLAQGFESLASKPNVCLPATQAVPETNECL